MKNKRNYICSVGVLIGLILNRILVNLYGNNGRSILVAVCLMIFLIVWGYLIFAKLYMGALIFSLVGVPIIIMSVGIFLDKLLFVLGGLVLTFAGVLIMKKYAPKIMENHKERQMEKNKEKME